MGDRDVVGSEASISVVLTTARDLAQAEALVRTLLEERLIACGNIVPGMLSLYRWKGEVASESEVLVVMKVDSRAVDRLFERIPGLHPYELPELVELPVAGVSAAYSRWVIESTEVSA
jgi:periplasmic divalent cation tolerance protein